MKTKNNILSVMLSRAKHLWHGAAPAHGSRGAGKLGMTMVMAVVLLALSACSEDEWPDKASDTRPDNSRTVSVNIQLPQGKPGFSETDTRTATTTDWTNGDELLMKVVLQVGETTYTDYITLTYNDTDWSVPDAAKLIAAETLTLNGTLKVSIPEAVTGEVTASVQLYYAPDCTWGENVSLKLKENPMTTAPEYWSFSNGSWTTTAARLRIHTGAEGDAVKLTATGFTDAFNNKAGTYTATTDAKGNAYFYGTMEEATSGFTVSVEEITLENNVTTVNAVTVLQASPLVPVMFEGGKSYMVDAEGAEPELAYKVTADGIYEVYTYEGLMAWNTAALSNLSTSVKLMANITLPTAGITVTNGQPTGSNWTPVGNDSNPYIGTIDGNGYTISRLRISSTSEFTGLVGSLGSGGTVKNLTLSDAVVYSTESWTGGIAGFISHGTVSGCTVSGSVKGSNYTGGIVAGNEGGTVSGCTVSGSVKGGELTGGILGYNIKIGTVIACGNSATVAGSNDVGGIVGTFDSGTFTGCWTSDTQENDWDIEVTEGKDGFGTIRGTATACYSFADASAVTTKDTDGKTPIDYMNTALTSARSPYRWQAVTGSWPTLVLSN